MEFLECSIPGPLIIQPKVFEDSRGFFMESWNRAEFARAGLELDFVQDNHSRSSRGVLRGLHYQNPMPQGKLMRVLNGRVFDVVVDLRRSSHSFGQWIGLELSAANQRMFWVPPGFAHGFLTLEDETDVLYKCTDFYQPVSEHCLLWDDPALAIEWPLEGIVPKVSAKDAAGKLLSACEPFA